eukprot:TRINITY_DN5007_c0_g1_i1.p1 TRINITY_DN5007_c0_g1~~TRINITY_DN5007_c0_g1_i1.p1  ORF type:complete len:319 (-),score=55.11 TRINITY_DN5007_c0_g1_i1:59-1015(-)
MMSSIFAFLNFLIGTLLVIAALGSYYKACVSDPGHVPEEWVKEMLVTLAREREKEQEQEQEKEENSSRDSAREDEVKLVVGSDVGDYHAIGDDKDNRDNELDPQEIENMRFHETDDPLDPPVMWCNFCLAPKPPRAHHCKICQRCILNMDHHCFFTGNCVGYKNQKHFILFLVYTSISTFQGIGLVLYWIYYMATETETDPSRIFVSIPRFIWMLFEFAVAYVGGMYAFYILTRHLKMHFTGYTPIEKKRFKTWKRKQKEQGKRFYYPFDFGVKKNFEILFGKSSLCFLPFTEPDLPHEGTRWTSSKKFKFQLMDLLD